MTDSTPDDDTSTTAAPRKRTAKRAAKQPTKQPAKQPARQPDRPSDRRPAKRAAKATAEAPARESAQEPAREPAREPAPRGSKLAMAAARQLQELTGSEVQGITGLQRTDDGWRVQVDLLELRRVPSTTDVIATYDVDVDGEGELSGYHRRHRYVRGEVGDDR